MKQRRPPAVLLPVAGLLLAALHTVDLLFWTDSVTGFAMVGPVWARYVLWLLVLALPYLPARHAAPQPAALSDTNLPLGIAMVAAGDLLLIGGFLTIPLALLMAQRPDLAGEVPPFAVWLDVILPVPAGLWLAVYGVRAMLGYGVRRGRVGSAVLAVVVPLCFLWRLVWRFQFVPASLSRLPCTMRVISAVAALLFATVLLKVFLVPGLPCGHTLFSVGMGCFLFCTCLELPQTLWETVNGMLALPDLINGLASGAFGLCGLVCAWAACGADAVETEE